MKNNNPTTTPVPVVDFQPAANPVDTSEKKAAPSKPQQQQQQQDRGCEINNAAKARQQQAQSPQL